MKLSLKNVNKALPRFDMIHRNYKLKGTAGFIDECQSFLESAYIDVTNCGECSIVLYGVGDAMYAWHYYGSDDAYDITEFIEMILEGETDRKAIVRKIRDHVQCIAESNE